MTLVFEDAPKQEPSDVLVDKKRGWLCERHGVVAVERFEYRHNDHATSA